MATAFAIRAAPFAVSSVATMSMMSAFGSTDDATLSSSVAAVSPGRLSSPPAPASRESSAARRSWRGGARRSSPSRVWRGSEALSRTIFAVAWYVFGSTSETSKTTATSGNDDEGDQQLAATKRIEIPPRLDRLVGRERRRRVPDQAVGAIDHFLVATVTRAESNPARGSPRCSPCRRLFPLLVDGAARGRRAVQAAGREFLGPSRLTKPANLDARARAYSSRVVAVTFILDGRPLGSDTTKPYELDVDPGAPSGRPPPAPGRRRRQPRAARVIHPDGHDDRALAVGRGESGARRELHRAREALRRGNVTVHLAPGRYEVRELELGSGTRLVGSGPGTVIAPPPGAPLLGAARRKGQHIRISDLTIDGGGGPAALSREGGIAVAVFDGSRDVRLQRLYITVSGPTRWTPGARTRASPSRTR